MKRFLSEPTIDAAHFLREAVESLEDSVELTVVEKLARLSHAVIVAKPPARDRPLWVVPREQPEVAEGPCHGDV